jgi:hypothetical protein
LSSEIRRKVPFRAAVLLPTAVSSDSKAGGVGLFSHIRMSCVLTLLQWRQTVTVARGYLLSGHIYQPGMSPFTGDRMMLNHIMADRRESLSAVHRLSLLCLTSRDGWYGHINENEKGLGIAFSFGFDVAQIGTWEQQHLLILIVFFFAYKSLRMYLFHL